MGELQDMACSSNNSSLGWDFHNNFGVFNRDIISSAAAAAADIDGNNGSFLSSLNCDFSTGYLEDALVEFNEKSKRRRFVVYDNEEMIKDRSSHILEKTYWNSNWEDYENFNPMFTGFNAFSGEAFSSPICKLREEYSRTVVTDIKTPEEDHTKSVLSDLDNYSSSSYKDSDNTKFLSHNDTILFPDHTAGHNTMRNNNNKRKRMMMSSSSTSTSTSTSTRVVYPFAVVKPGGIEGDVTLNDINERILMPPTRPVRHPVGDFACRSCVSPQGSSGISGKAVVALTKIHTQGKGTITIIRTKG